MNHLYLALLTDDLKRAEVVREAFADEVRIQTGEGIQEDYSFHQHGPLLYTGGYGRGFTEDVAEYIWTQGGLFCGSSSGRFGFLRRRVLSRNVGPRSVKIKHRLAKVE